MLGGERELREGGKERSEVAENRGNALRLAEKEEVEEKKVGVRALGKEGVCRGGGK